METQQHQPPVLTSPPSCSAPATMPWAPTSGSAGPIELPTKAPAADPFAGFVVTLPRPHPNASAATEAEQQQQEQPSQLQQLAPTSPPTNPQAPHERPPASNLGGDPLESALLDAACIDPAAGDRPGFAAAPTFDEIRRWHATGRATVPPPCCTHRNPKSPEAAAARQVFIGQLPAFVGEDVLAMALEYALGTPGAVVHSIIKRSTTGSRDAPTWYAMVCVRTEAIAAQLCGFSRHIYFTPRRAFFSAEATSRRAIGAASNSPDPKAAGALSGVAGAAEALQRAVTEVLTADSNGTSPALAGQLSPESAAGSQQGPVQPRRLQAELGYMRSTLVINPAQHKAQPAFAPGIPPGGRQPPVQLSPHVVGPSPAINLPDAVRYATLPPQQQFAPPQQQPQFQQQPPQQQQLPVFVGNDGVRFVQLPPQHQPQQQQQQQAQQFQQPFFQQQAPQEPPHLMNFAQRPGQQQQHQQPQQQQALFHQTQPQHLQQHQQLAGQPLQMPAGAPFAGAAPLPQYQQYQQQQQQQQGYGMMPQQQQQQPAVPTLYLDSNGQLSYRP